MEIGWLPQGIVAVLVGVAVWFITSRIESIRRETERLQDERRKIYMHILEPVIRITAGSNNPSETQTALTQVTSFEYRKAFFELNMTGSDEVVLAVNSFMQYIYGLDAEGQSVVPRDLVAIWGGLILAIRRDLVSKKTKLKEIDMLRSMIKDIDTVANA